jgi:hypothetical protein
MAHYRSSRRNEATQRFQERRSREDEAPRLLAEVPGLSSLSLVIEERAGSNVGALAKHVRHVVVGRAPALFFLGCSDPNCKDGGHDVTGPVMRALAGHRPTFEGEDSCHGTVGSEACSRVLHYQATAGYA